MAAGDAIDRLVVALGFEVDTSGITDWVNSAIEANKATLGLVAGLGLVAAAIGGATIAIAAGMDELGDFAELNDIAATTVSELGYAAVINGSSIDAMNSSIAGLNKVIGEAAIGIGRGEKTFEKLGLSAKTSTGEVKSFEMVLEEVADKMQGLSKQESIAMAQKLGIDPTLVPLLQKGSAAIREAREEIAFFTPDQRGFDAAGELLDTLDKLGAMAKGTGQFIAVFFMPAIRDLLEGFRQWWLLNKVLIRDNLLTILKLTSAFFRALWEWIVRIVSPLNYLVQLFGGWNKVAIAVGIALGVIVATKFAQFIVQTTLLMPRLIAMFAAWAATIGWLPILIALVVAAIGLLIDDLVNFAEGNDSLIGRLIEQYPALGAVVEQVTATMAQAWEFLLSLWTDKLGPAFGRLGEALVALFTALWPIATTLFGIIVDVLAAVLPVAITVLAALIGALTQIVAAMISMFTSGLSWIIDLLGLLVSGLALVATALVTVFTNGIDQLKAGFMGLYDFVMGIFRSIGDFAGGVIDKIVGGVNKVAGWLGFGKTAATTGAAAPGGTAAASSGTSLVSGEAFRPTAPLGAAGSPGSTTTQSQTVNVTAPITVNTNDPATAGQSVREEFNNMARREVRNSQSAVAL